jgi:hypothetical protein
VLNVLLLPLLLLILPLLMLAVLLLDMLPLLFDVLLAVLLLLTLDVLLLLVLDVRLLMPPQLFAFGTFAVLALLAMMLLLDVMTGANVVIELGAVPALPSGLPPEFICREGELVSCANLAITEENCL